MSSKIKRLMVKTQINWLHHPPGAVSPVTAMGSVLVGVPPPAFISLVGVGVSFPVMGTGSCVRVKKAADVLVGGVVPVATMVAEGM